MAGKPIILKPQFRVRFPRVLWDIGQRSIPWWKGGIEDVSAEGLRSQKVGAWASVLTAVVASATTRVVATASPLPCITASMPTGIEGVACVAVEAETLMHRDHDAWPAALLRLVD